MGTNERAVSNLAIPPGEYLEEVIAELGMTKDELAKRMDRPAPKLTQIFKGEKAITPDTALQLETVTGVPAHIWTGLEAEYRLALARREEEAREERLSGEVELVSKYPYADLVACGELPKLTKPKEKVKALQDYLAVRSLRIVPRLSRYEAAFRVGRSGRGIRSPEAIAAWLRMGERRAQKVKCAPFDAARLRSILPSLRAMTLQSPREFQAPLIELMADAGVALVICPHFSKTQMHGAVFWMGREKAVLMITIRGRWADVFWFSLFHEIGHLLLRGNRQSVIVENDDRGQSEDGADAFAAEALIPREGYRSLVGARRYSLAEIQKFSRQFGVHPGIVVGRLQHDKLLSPTVGNHLRERYAWV
jgi:HTH-type transcriptional regulator / antitoxin HigA